MRWHIQKCYFLLLVLFMKAPSRRQGALMVANQAIFIHAFLTPQWLHLKNGLQPWKGGSVVWLLPRAWRPLRACSLLSCKRATILLARAAYLAPRTLSLTAISDRKSTRLNSSHVSISYAVFCLKKKK